MKTVEVGCVCRPHGLAGEVRIRLHWPESVALLGAQRVLLSDSAGQQWMDVEAVRRVPRGVLLKLAQINSREAAESLRDSRVSVAREALPQLEQGEYYLFELVGASVVTPSGPLGKVVEIRVYPSVDALVIRTTDGELAEQPLAEPWVESIDPGNGIVSLRSTEGLLR